MKFWRILSAAVLLPAILPVSAIASEHESGSGSISLEECRTLARNNYPEIRQYDMVSLAEEYTVSNAARAWLPQITLGAQATIQNKVPSFPEAFSTIMSQMGTSMPGLRKDQYKVSVDVSQPIYDGGKSKADKALAQADAQQQKSTVDVDLYSVESRVDNLYFGILLLDNSIEQTEAAKDLLESNLDKLRSLVRNGAALSSDADALEAELLTLNQNISQLEASRQSYRTMLELFIGKSLANDTLATPEMPSMLSSENHRPELSAIDASIAKINAQEKLLDVAIRPQIGLFAQSYYGYPGFDYFASMMNHDWSFNALAGVRVAWNISSFYTRSNNRNKLENARNQLNLQKDIFLFNTNLQTVQQNNEITRLEKLVSDDERIAQLRGNVRAAAESKLRNGVIDTSDLLGKITDEKNAKVNLSNHRIELLKAAYELKHTINE